MTDRPASWRMPTPKQMDKMAPAASRKASPTRGLAQDADLSPEYWQAILEDPRAEAPQPANGASGRMLRMSQIPEHLLRVGCRRCGRTIEIQKVDATRLYGPDAVWRDIGQRLLGSTCTRRTGRHEEDGCWPQFE
jgi:hypothetical protein